MPLKAWVFFIASGMLFLFAAIASVNTLRFLQQSVVTTGSVEKLNAGGSHPEIAFTTARGERISYPQGGIVSGWKVGDQVEVRYLPSQPRRASMNRLGALWTWEIALLILGLGMLWAGYSSLI